MKGRNTLLSVIVMLGVLAPLAEGQVRSAASRFHIRRWLTRRVEVPVTQTFSFPSALGEIQEIVVVAAKPPETVEQRDVSVVIEVNGKEVPAVELKDQLGRPYLRATVPVSLRAGSTLQVAARYRATFYASRLEDGATTRAPAPLSEEERRFALQPTPTCDFQAPGFQRWLDAKKLRWDKQKQNDLDFAYDAYRAITKSAVYGDAHHKWNSSEMCWSGVADCGGSSVWFVAAMRANGIPARTRHGWVAAPEMKEAELHCRAEVYLQGLGWQPVEVACALGKDDRMAVGCFSYDKGDHLILHTDNDYEIEYEPGRTSSMKWLQCPAFYVTKATAPFGDIKSVVSSPIKQLTSAPISKSP